MLKIMGYNVVLTMKKTRSIYFVSKYHITVDSLEGLGDFVKFAIMTDDGSLLDGYRSKLIILVDKFGLSSTNLEYRSYRKIYSESLTL